MGESDDRGGVGNLVEAEWRILDEEDLATRYIFLLLFFFVGGLILVLEGGKPPTGCLFHNLLTSSRYNVHGVLYRLSVVMLHFVNDKAHRWVYMTNVEFPRRIGIKKTNHQRQSRFRRAKRLIFHHFRTFFRVGSHHRIKEPNCFSPRFSFH